MKMLIAGKCGHNRGMDIEVTIASHNEVKIDRIKNALLSFQIKSLDWKEYLYTLPEVDDIAGDTLSRAEAKALLYSQSIPGIVLASDFNLRLDSPPHGLRPYLARQGKFEVSPEVALAWQEWFDEHNGVVGGHWECGFALADSGYLIKSLTVPIPRFFTNRSDCARRQGFSFASLDEGKIEVFEAPTINADAYWAACLGAPLTGLILSGRRSLVFT